MFKQTFEMKTAPHSVTQPKKNKIKRDSVIKQVANGRGQQSGAVGRPQVYVYKRRLTPANKTLKCVVPCLFDNEFFFRSMANWKTNREKALGHPQIYISAQPVVVGAYVSHIAYIYDVVAFSTCLVLGNSYLSQNYEPV
jgi:hypothetical protein